MMVDWRALTDICFGGEAETPWLRPPKPNTRPWNDRPKCGVGRKQHHVRHAVPLIVARALTERTMGRIALLWLLLTPVWIAFSFSASSSKIAFLPPGLVAVALVFYWLHNQFVLLVAGEHEPHAEVDSSRGSHFQPVAAASLVGPAFVAIALGACLGAAAVTSFFVFDLHDSAVSQKTAAGDAIQPGSMIDVQPKAVKPQSFPAEQTTQNNSHVTSSDNPDAKRTEVQTQTLGEALSRAVMFHCAKTATNLFVLQIVRTSRIPDRGNTARGKIAASEDYP